MLVYQAVSPGTSWVGLIGEVLGPKELMEILDRRARFEATVEVFKIRKVLW